MEEVMDIRGYVIQPDTEQTLRLVADDDRPPHFLYGPYSDGVKTTVVRGGRIMDGDVELQRASIGDSKVLGEMFNSGTPLSFDPVLALPPGAFIDWDNATE